jgi:hypothetical protein
MKPTNKSLSGTSSFYQTVETTIEKLIQAIGQPTYDGRGKGYDADADKTQVEWDLETSTGEVISLYDYKEYKWLSNNEVVKFHIGSYNLEASVFAKTELENLLAKL